MDTIESTPLLNLTAATRKRRIAAFLIDYAVIMCVFSLLSCIVFGEIDNQMIMLSLVFPMLIVLLLILFSKDIFNGISIGKWITGLQVVNNTDNNIPSKANLFIRNIPQLIFFVEFFVLAISNDKRRIGDLLANTRVVNNPQKAVKNMRIGAFVAVSVLIPLFMILSIILTLSNSPAYTVSKEAVKNNTEIEQATGGITGFSRYISGSINHENSYGKAVLHFTIYGVKKDVEVTSYVIKTDSTDWQVIKIQKH